jgi:hypothetical protein
LRFVETGGYAMYATALTTLDITSHEKPPEKHRQMTANDRAG